MLRGSPESGTQTREMPFLINLETREITEVTKRPSGQWVNIDIPCKRLINYHHDVEMGYVPAYGIRNLETGVFIVQRRHMAHHIEYYSSGADDIAYTSGSPMSVVFN